MDAQTREPTGAVAAGHPDTARVGMQMLRDGGNAADAVVAMVAAATVVESSLTSLAGGAFFLVSPPDQPAHVVDAFVRAPGLSARPWLAPWEVFNLDLDGTVLRYGTGPASVAVPGVVAGMARVSEQWGRMGFERSLLPAVQLADQGVLVTEGQEQELRLNVDMLLRSAYATSVFLDASGAPLRTGDLLRQPVLGAAMEEIAATGGRSMYDGGIARAIAAWSNERGGRIGAEDLAAYDVQAHPPIHEMFGDCLLVANPAPSYGGGILQRLMHRLHEDLGVGWRGRATHHSDSTRDRLVAHAIVDVVRETNAPRTVPPDDGELVAGVDRPPFSRSPSTTHVAAIDRDGLHASATSTVGYGSGEWIPGYGIQLNNMLAEYDHTIVRAPGSPIPSMMTPSVWRQHDGHVVGIGSAGSDRIPLAIGQVLSHVASGCTIAEAIERPRIIFDGTHLHLEPGIEIDRELPDVLRCEWDRNDAYFGTTNAVGVENGLPIAAADPRRGCIALNE